MGMAFVLGFHVSSGARSLNVYAEIINSLHDILTNNTYIHLDSINTNVTHPFLRFRTCRLQFICLM